MKRVTVARAITGVIFLAAGTTQALAICSTTGRMSGNAIVSTLKPTTNTAPTTTAAANADTFALYSPGPNTEAIVGTSTTGAIWDYKKGPGSTSDPPTNIGTYTITGTTGTGTINYNYGGTASYTYYIYTGTGSPYTFCNTGTGTNLPSTVTVQTGP